jgi:hypothetical protein
MACLVYAGGTELERPVTVESFDRVVEGMSLPSPVTARNGADGVRVADRVELPGGRGALVSTLTSPGAPGTGSAYLVSDQGIKYPLPRADVDGVTTALGFGGVRPVAVPHSILALLPTGPALSREAATRFATVATADPEPSR